MSAQRTITYQQWVDEFNPVFDTPDGSSLVQYPSWRSIPAEVDLGTVWAVTEEEDEWFVLPGYHLVNVLYFTRTETPWDEEDLVVVEWGD